MALFLAGFLLLTTGAGRSGISSRACSRGSFLDSSFTIGSIESSPSDFAAGFCREGSRPMAGSPKFPDISANFPGFHNNRKPVKIQSNSWLCQRILQFGDIITYHVKKVKFSVYFLYYVNFLRNYVNALAHVPAISPAGHPNWREAEELGKLPDFARDCSIFHQKISVFFGENVICFFPLFFDKIQSEQNYRKGRC